MPTSDDNSPSSSPRYTPWLAAWAIFLAAVFGFGWYKSAENAREWRAAREWDAHHRQLMADGKTEWTRLIAHLSSLRMTAGSQQLLEEELNGGRPFKLRQAESGEFVEWTDPKYGGQITLQFRDGTLIGHRGNWGTGRILALRPQPLRQAYGNTADVIRRRIANAGVYTWAAALVAWVVMNRRRLLAAQVMLGAALASGMAWLVNPLYSITSQGVFSNDHLFWAIPMIVASVYLLAVTLSVYSTDFDFILPPFRFDLRQLLLAVTVIAVLLAAGPFGFVVLLVAVAGALLFMLIWSHYRSRETAMKTGMDGM